MRKVNEALNHICHRLDDIRDLLRSVLHEQGDIKSIAMRAKDEAVVISDLLEDQNEQLDMLLSTPGGRVVEVKAVETTDGKSMFLVSGDELVDLLQACSGATMRMKKEAEEK